MPTTPMLGSVDRRAASNPNRTRRDVRRSRRGAERAEVRREAARYIRATRRSQP